MRVLVSGAVQGVWFRESTRREAEARGVAGWVRNLPDGRVEAVFEGPVHDVEAMVAWCQRGPPNARVEAVKATPELATGDVQGFNVVREGRA